MSQGWPPGYGPPRGPSGDPAGPAGPPAYGPPPGPTQYGPPPGYAPPQPLPPSPAGWPGAAPLPPPNPPAQAWPPAPPPPPVASWAGPANVLPVDATTAALARHDPDQMFLLELLCSGILGLPGIGHIAIGDVGIGVPVLIGYPIVFWSIFTLVTIFTCGIGAFLIAFMWPANFLLGFFLANRVKTRILDARRAMGMIR